MSVYLSGPRPQVDPRTVPDGTVLFNITNQTGRTERIAIAAPDGRVLAHSSAIAPNGTAQLQTKLWSPVGWGVEYLGAPRSLTELTMVRGPERAGDSALLQP